MDEGQQAVVHIVDDDAGMLKSLLMVAESVSLRARGYESAEAFLAQITPDHPGCLILDLRMGGMSGIDLLQRLRTDLNDIPVIMISAHADVPATVRAMKLGAVDLMQKPVDPNELVAAIHRCLKLSHSLHQQRASDALVRRRFENLTQRELELLPLIVDGKLNKQIAVIMGISVKTVANHRASLMSKTGASNGADLARLFMLFNAERGEHGPPPAVKNTSA